MQMIQKYFEIVYMGIVILSVLIGTIFGVRSVIVSIKKRRQNGEISDTQAIKLATLEIREIARNAIYEVEAQYKHMKTQGIKAGAFKLDSVLKTVDNECLRRGITFNKEEVTSYVNEEVSKMKLVQ